MKKVTAILIVLVILLAGFQAVISTHICGGRIADHKVSLNGNLASCGMEGDEGTCPISGSQVNRHCCEDHISIAAVINQFTVPASEDDNILKNISDFSFTEIHGLNPASLFHTASLTGFYPPGCNPTVSVSLEKICVFRI